MCLFVLILCFFMVNICNFLVVEGLVEILIECLYFLERTGKMKKNP